MKGKYYYLPRFTWWNVYNESGTKVSEFRTKEEARKEVYRLNGWDRTLKLTVHKNWFNLTLTGEKKEEYRKPSDWIKSRLIGKEYDNVELTNGYGTEKPYILIGYKGYRISTENFTVKYSNGSTVDVEIGDIIIALGGILNTGNIQNE